MSSKLMLMDISSGKLWMVMGIMNNEKNQESSDEHLKIESKCTCGNPAYLCNAETLRQSTSARKRHN